MKSRPTPKIQTHIVSVPWLQALYTVPDPHRPLPCEKRRLSKFPAEKGGTNAASCRSVCDIADDTANNRSAVLRTPYAVRTTYGRPKNPKEGKEPKKRAEWVMGMFFSAHSARAINSRLEFNIQFHISKFRVIHMENRSVFPIRNVLRFRFGTICRGAYAVRTLVRKRLRKRSAERFVPYLL